MQAESLAAWVEMTQLARFVGESMWVIATLSAIHLLGFTLVMGGALLLNLRFAGVLLSRSPPGQVARPASRGIAIGLVISIVTGILLASWKATEVISGGIFQIKMLLLMAAALLHFTWQRAQVRNAATAVSRLRLSGVLGLALWLGLALAGCAFILFE